MVSSLSFLDPSLQSVKREITSSEQIPFLDIFSGSEWQDLLLQEGIQYRERVFPPLVTLWTFVSQILNPDHSCRFAVAQWIASCIGKGRQPASSITSAYCRARQKLPESFYRRVALHLGERLSRENPSSWRWKNHVVKIVDGSTLKLPDTKPNQKEYPQRKGQKEGLGFPTLRILTVVSLSCGAVIDAAFSCIQGKETGEPALLRSLISSFNPGDVLLADRFFSGYFNICYWMRHRVELVLSQHHTRNEWSMKEVKRLKKNDRIVALKRPFRRAFTWENGSMSYDDFPPAILLREITFTIRRRGFRPRTIRVITTFLNPVEYSSDDILRLYAARWNVETDFLNLKVGLGMDALRCKSPSMVRKEIWAHLIAYNFVRLIIAQAASLSQKTPRSISFQGCVQILQAFRHALTTCSGSSRRSLIHTTMLKEISKHRIGNRPGRYEPRVLKRRFSNTYPFLTLPRAVARKMRLINRKGQANRYARFTSA